MKRTAKLALAAVAALGVAAVAVPVVADQAHYGWQAGGTMMGAGAPMQAGGTMMGGGMAGMMMGTAQTNVMATFDANKDGTLSPEEMTAGIQGQIKTYDTDANGTLSLDEFAALHAAISRPMTVRAFQMQDSDGDAQVTEAEMAAIVTTMQGHMSGHPVAMPGGMPGIGHGMMGSY